MKLYTSYWAQVRNFPKTLFGLNTTIWPPKWRPLGADKRGIYVINCPILQPGPSCDGLCAGKCNPKHPHDCAFLQTYRHQLDQLDFNDFMKHLHLIHDNYCKDEKLEDVDFALIVFEKYDNPCSERWPLQHWIRENGLSIEEWMPNI